MAVSFRLFSPDDEGLPRGAQLSLAQFYEQYFAPLRLGGRRAPTIKQYAESVRLWAAITGDPPLAAIDDFVAEKFLEGLRSRPGLVAELLADHTIKKHVTHVQAVLNLAGPRSRSCKKGQGFLDDVVQIEPPRCELDEVTGDFTLPEIGLWLEACGRAKEPRLDGVTPAEWWRALVLFGYNTGLRIKTLLALRYQWLYTHERGAWLCLAVPSADLKQGRKQHVYLNQWARAAMESISPPLTPNPSPLRTGARGAIPARELIFPWRLTEAPLHDWRRKILAASELPAHRHLGFHGLRKALGTEGGLINPRGASMALGHRTKDITRDHYTAFRVMVETLDRLPQPTWRTDREGRQRLLF